MFYKLIKKKSDEWFNSDDCTVKNMIDYMVEKDALRDAQIEAIKVFLYLKIKCQNKKIIDLIKNGVFADKTILDKIELNNNQKNIFENNNIALSLLTYSSLTDGENEESKKTLNTLNRYLKDNCENIDFYEELNKILATNNYPEYVFSLPMGAGKTYLMACFIYLNLYFAINEPNNESFSHNFLIMAPSGLKNSIVPSLKTIENFDPTFVLPKEVAYKIKNIIKFEALDEDKTKKKSNMANNPNVQKIMRNGDPKNSFGLVLVVNAEKLILDDKGELAPLDDYMLRRFNDDNEYEKKKKELLYDNANELRDVISKIPKMSVLVDEIHHVVEDSIKARQVINKWSLKNGINSLIGFSGTPYLDKSIDLCSLKTNDIPQIVYYYPLINGIDNFLKRPEIVVDDASDYKKIIKTGLKRFFEKYDKIYKNGVSSKLAIYCGRIDKLNNEVFPIVKEELKKYNLNNDVILRYYGESKVDKKDINYENYKLEKDAEYNFLTLDSVDNIKRIVLLVGIGKEGWDCKSLTGVILASKGDCKKKVILQTSCRCLRKIDKNNYEDALIVLNESNAKDLQNELKQSCHTNIEELQKVNHNGNVMKFYDRTKVLRLPNIEYIDLSIQTELKEVEKVDTKKEIINSYKDIEDKNNMLKTYTAEGFIDNEIQNIKENNISENDEVITYNDFINAIMRDSFNMITYENIKKYDKELYDLFLNITYCDKKNKNIRYAKNMHNIEEVLKNVRLSFSNKYTLIQNEEEIPRNAKLLYVDNFVNEKYVENKEKYFPDNDKVEKIVDADNGKIQQIDDETKNIIESLKKKGKLKQAKAIEDDFNVDNEILDIKNRAYHYIPYKSDSNFEKEVYDKITKSPIIKENNLEVYFNGDDNLTEFKIKCYKIDDKGLKSYIGRYVPDFLIIKREDDKIKKVLILETKGKIYASDPKFIDKKLWVENYFLKINNKNYNKYDYVYIEDTKSVNERFNIINNKIIEFFVEGKNG